jgi:hypothetical protein
LKTLTSLGSGWVLPIIVGLLTLALGSEEADKLGNIGFLKDLGGHWIVWFVASFLTVYAARKTANGGVPKS